MAGNKGKPSGKFAEKKTEPGRKGGYQRTGWPETSSSKRSGASNSGRTATKKSRAR